MGGLVGAIIALFIGVIFADTIRPIFAKIPVIGGLMNVNTNTSTKGEDE
ncbi:MAG: hypothetical protein K9J13_13855 [Saprospiraceae bacterium]|nr:hypothetical protein [Saprospiraceae bacterium]